MRVRGGRCRREHPLPATRQPLSIPVIATDMPSRSDARRRSDRRGSGRVHGGYPGGSFVERPHGSVRRCARPCAAAGARTEWALGGSRAPGAACVLHRRPIREPGRRRGLAARRAALRRHSTGVTASGDPGPRTRARRATGHARSVSSFCTTGFLSWLHSAVHSRRSASPARRGQATCPERPRRPASARGRRAAARRRTCANTRG